MIIKPSPVRSDDEITYKFNNDKILATINNEDELLFDLSNIEVGKQYEPVFPIHDVCKKRENSRIEIKLVKYHGADASEEERFPDPFEAVNEEFETDAESVQLEELVIEEPTHQPTAEQRLEALEATMIEMLGGNL